MMNRIKFILLGLTLIFFVSGCGERPESSESVGAGLVPAPDVRAPTRGAPTDLAQAGTLKGKVFFEGEAPAPAIIPIRGNPECSAFHANGAIHSEELLVKDGALQNVFVYVKEGLDDRGRGELNSPQMASQSGRIQYAPTPPPPVTIANKNCVYVPHVSGVQVDQPVILLNGDPTLHNVHSYSKNQKAWNLGLPFQGMKQTKKFSNSEVMVQLKCDVHPWMIGYVGVLPHPYFSVTNDEGIFEIKNLPSGEYSVEAWHEKLGVQSQKIKIEPQETKEISFRFKM